MGSVKIRTNSGVRMSAPIDTTAELDKVIKFLVAEREPKDVPSVPSAVSQEDDGVSEEVVAVIAAAVAMMYGGQGRAKIKSIRRAGGRSAWANAGVLDNTRPF